MTTASSKRKKLPRYPEVQVSMGDLALTLAGYKTLHYFSDGKDIQPNTTVLLTCGRGENKIRVPVVIDTSKSIPSDTVLTPEEIKATGRYVTGEYKHPIGTRDTARNQERAARLAAEPKLPASYHASDISGHTPGGRVSCAVFHVKTAEALKPKDAKRFRGYLRNAYSQLAPLVQEAHTYEFPRLGKDANGNPVPLPAIPEDMSMVRAVRFMSKELNTSSLNAILSPLALPGTISSKRNPGMGPDYKGDADTTIDGIGLGRMLAAYPSLRVDQGAGVLAAMGAINMIASPAPLQSKFTNADGSMLITLRAVQKNKVNGGDYNFEYPVVVPLQEPMALKASEVTDQLAQACGYRNAEVMLKAKGSPEFLHFYTFRQYLLGEVPLYEEAGGKHNIDFMHGANNAWLNSSDTSMKFARDYVDSFPEDQRIEFIKHITNRRHLHEVDPNAPAPLMKRNGKGPLPADTQRYWELRALEGSNHAAMVIGDHKPEAVAAALAAKQQAVQDADAANHAKQKLVAGGVGWSATAKRPSAERYGRTKTTDGAEKRKTRLNDEEIAERNRERYRWRREKHEFRRELAGEISHPRIDLDNIELINPDKRPAPKPDPEHGHMTHNMHLPSEHRPTEEVVALSTRDQETPDGEKAWAEKVPAPQSPARKIKSKKDGAEDKDSGPELAGKTQLIRGRWRQVPKHGTHVLQIQEGEGQAGGSSGPGGKR